KACRRSRIARTRRRSGGRQVSLVLPRLVLVPATAQGYPRRCTNTRISALPMGPTVAATPQLPKQAPGRPYGAAAALADPLAFAGAFALWNPPLRGLAAHTFR